MHSATHPSRHRSKMSPSNVAARIPVRVAPSTPADLPGIATCELLAFSGAYPPYDNFCRLLYPFRAPLARSGTHTRYWPDFQSTIRLREQNICNGSITFTAFVTDDTGKEIPAGWAKMTPPREVLENTRRGRKWKERVLNDVLYPAAEKVRSTLWKDADGMNTEFWRLFKTEQNASRERIDKDGRYYLLAIFYVHPSYQNRGVGSALLEYCTDLADASQTPLFLEASPAGSLLYKNRGFVQVDAIRFTYKEEQIVMPCMIRQPMPPKEQHENVMKEVDDLAERNKADAEEATRISLKSAKIGKRADEES